MAHYIGQSQELGWVLSVRLWALDLTLNKILKHIHTYILYMYIYIWIYIYMDIHIYIYIYIFIWNHVLWV